MKESRHLIEQAMSGIRPARTPLFDLLVNDAVIEHFAGEPLDGVDDEGAARKASGRALDGTRWIPAPSREGETWHDAMGNTHTKSRGTSWLTNHVLGGIGAILHLRKHKRSVR